MGRLLDDFGREITEDEWLDKTYQDYDLTDEDEDDTTEALVNPMAIVNAYRRRKYGKE